MLRPVASFAEAAQRFPGLESLDPKAVGRFAFHAAGNFPETLEREEVEREDEWDLPDREPWVDVVSGVIFSVKRWRDQEGKQGTPSRLELANQITAELEYDRETTALIKGLDELSADDGFEAVSSYLQKWEYQPTMKMSPSPLFPDGRVKYGRLQDCIDHEGRKFDIPYDYSLSRSSHDESRSGLAEGVEEYVNKGHMRRVAQEQTQEALSSMGEMDAQELQRLRSLYGAKAAHLVMFDRTLDSLYQKLDKEQGRVMSIDIPPYVAVAVDMYEGWVHNSPNYRDMLEATHKAALEIVEGLGGLVAIRSSAVHSEDGAEHSGAGIYHSTVVDPTNFEHFVEAIEEVYRSTDSAAAVAYRNQHGIDNESMGLVIQSYEEERDDHSKSAYGYVNGSGANPNLIEVSTPVGTLFFDKQKITDHLLTTSWYGEDLHLHSTPDHSTDLRRMPHAVIEAVHAAVLGEKIFGMPMQVEYVAGGKVVQLRPLPRGAYESHADIQFPEDLDLISSTKAIGVGDYTLQELREHGDNSDQEGVVIMWTEHMFTASRGIGPWVLPSKGAVIILNHSDSGHVQTLCQEKGLLCLYPDASSEELLDLKRFLDEVQDTRRDGEEPITLRIVSNGYEGRIYKPQETKS